MRRHAGDVGQMAETEALQIGQRQSAAGRSHVRQGGGIGIAITVRVWEGAQADAVEDDPDRPSGPACHGSPAASRHWRRIVTPALVPMRVTPAASNSRQKGQSRIPPDALT
jgi:hypothetical protein